MLWFHKKDFGGKVGVLWLYKLFYCIEFFDKHHCLTIPEIVKTYQSQI